MAANCHFILQHPPNVTIVEHRSGFSIRVAEDILPAVVTPDVCSAYILHKIGFVAEAVLQKDMEVGQ
jgi:hypothetical protein